MANASPHSAASGFRPGGIYSPCSRARQKGFTLIEVIVSLGLLTLTASLMAAGVLTITNRWEAYAASMGWQDMLVRARAVIRRDIAAMQKIQWIDREKSGLVFYGTQQQLQFVSLEPPYPGERGLYLLSYGSSGNNGLTRSHSRYHPEIRDLNTVSFSDSVTVLSEQYNILFSFGEITKAGWVWHRSWSKSEPSSVSNSDIKTGKLPDLIRLEVYHAGTSTHVTPPMVFRTRVDAVPDCIAHSKSCAPPAGGGEKVIEAPS